MDESERKKAIQLVREMRQEDNENNAEKESLTWMYKGSKDLVDREEYLLGKAIGKSFEASKDGGNCDIISRSYEPSNVPKRLLGKSDNTEQIDIANKILEDPLYAIKKKELEARKKLLDNPVKLKELQKMIMERNSLKFQKKEEKKRRKKKKNGKDHEIDEKNLDNLIIRKLKKFNVSNKVKFLRQTLQNLSSSESEKEYVKKKKVKKMKSRRKRSKSSCSTATDSSSLADENSKNLKRKKLTRSESKKRKNYVSLQGNEKRFQKRIKTQQSKDDSHENRGRKNFKKCNKVKRIRNHSEGFRNSSESLNSSLSSNSGSSVSSSLFSNDSTKNNNSEKKNKIKNKKVSNRRIFENSEKNCPKKRKTETSIKKCEKRNLVRQTGNNKKHIYSSNKGKNTFKPHSSSDSSSDGRPSYQNTFKRHVRTEVSDRVKSRKKFSGIPNFKKETHNDLKQVVQFSEKEIEAKVQEMTENAKLRKEDRERNLANHRRKQSEEEKIKDYDEKFIRRQISLATSQGTMADRIKSNINNIQRSKADMDKSFIKK